MPTHGTLVRVATLMSVAHRMDILDNDGEQTASTDNGRRRAISVVTFVLRGYSPDVTDLKVTARWFDATIDQAAITAA